MTNNKNGNWLTVSLMAVVAFAALAVPTKALALGVPSIPELILNNLQIRTCLDDYLTGAWRHAESPLIAELKLQQGHDAAKRRLDAEFARHRQFICNSPLLGPSQRPWCIDKLNASYEARLSELRRRFDAERAKLTRRQF